MRPQSKLRVLLVPDYLQWITGEIAKRIAYHNEEWIEATICSGQVLKDLMDRCGSFPGEVDLVHFLTEWEAELLLPRFEGKVSCVITIHHVEDERFVPLLPRSDATMTACRQWHEYLSKYQLNSDKLVMVPYGVDTNRFRPPVAGERERLRAQVGLPPDAYVVGFCAKRSSDSSGRKGIDTLLQAIAEMRRRQPRISILVVGPGWGDLVEQMRAEGVPCVQIPFIIDPDEFANVYRCLDTYWITSRIEGGPVPLLEAMASGVCCVTTPVGMAIDIVRDGDNALIAPIDDAEAFVRLTERLLSDPDLRRWMGVAARNTIVDGYQWRQTTCRVWPLYQKAIERFRARTGSAPVLPEPRWGPPRSKCADEPRLASLPRWAHAWVTARDHFFFTRTLRWMGETRVADQMELRAIRWKHFINPVWRKEGYDCSVSNYWWAFNNGMRRSVFVHGLRAIVWRPWCPGGWRLLVLALVKKIRRREMT